MTDKTLDEVVETTVGNVGVGENLTRQQLDHAISLIIIKDQQARIKELEARLKESELDER